MHTTDMKILHTAKQYSRKSIKFNRITDFEWLAHWLALLRIRIYNVILGAYICSCSVIRSRQFCCASVHLQMQVLRYAFDEFGSISTGRGACCSFLIPVFYLFKPAELHRSTSISIFIYRCLCVYGTLAWLG